MATPEPTITGISKAQADAQSNPYNGRWRWWYVAIADWMLRNPGKALQECARELGKNPNTIYYITSSDTFRDYFSRRRMEHSEEHDRRLRTKLVSVAEKSLDSVIAQLDKRGDQTPLPLAAKIAESSLDRLGFAPKTQVAPQAATLNVDARTVVLNGVTPTALEEARAALRLAERRRSAEPLDDAPAPAHRGGEEAEHRTLLDLEVLAEATHAPSLVLDPGPDVSGS